MLLTAELLLHYQRCNRRAYLEVYGDLTQRDPPSDYLRKLARDSRLHRRQVLADQVLHQPHYPAGDWAAGSRATTDLMQQGVEAIHQGVLAVSSETGVTLVGNPDLLVKHPGQSIFGDWIYVPTDIKLGKRPKLEYQILSAFHTQLLAAVQGAWPETAWLWLREKGTYAVDLWTVLPQMQAILTDCIQTLEDNQAPEVFIARNRCSLCPWLNYCYDIAQAEAHLSLLPGVTISRYTQLKALNLTTTESLATLTPIQLEKLPGFGQEVAQKLVQQAQSKLQNRAIAKDSALFNVAQELPTTDVELYFDIEAEPELNLAYLHGVLVVDRSTQTEQFHALLAESPAEEAEIWEQFLDLVWQYPQAPIFHFCPYEVQTVERLAKLYKTPGARIRPLRSRFVDLHERVTRAVTLPVESYALKPIARWMGFDWRDPSANGAQAICWYSDWLATQERSHLSAIVRYNEDDCRAMYHLKTWLVDFFQSSANSPAELLTAHPTSPQNT